MEHWQFLIQKQGDRSWQSLESPSTEIREGRYRVLALSQLPDKDVEVRVTHFSPQETPPKRRIQKRVRRTNADGLMAVIPFTYLKPGIWELRCSGDLMSDMLGQPWQYGVYLQVLSQEVDEAGADPKPESFNYPSESGLVSDGFTELGITNQNQFLATDIDPERLNDEPVSPVWVKGETAEQILQNLIDLALPTSDPLIPEEKVEESPRQQSQCPLVLTLDRETYITRWGHVLTIYGNVQLGEHYQTDRNFQPENLYNLELRIELRSPESLAVLTQIRQSLGEQTLPFTLRSAIDIPAECESKLILADISLYGCILTAEEMTLLASQSFTITADVTQLLAVTKTTSSSHDTHTPSISTPEPSIRLDLELFNLVKNPPTGESQLSYPVANIPLPESIAPLAIQKTVDSRGLQLPKLPEHQTDVVISEDGLAESNLADAVSIQDETTVPMTPAPINLEQLVIKHRRSRLHGSSFPYLKRLQTAAATTEVVNDEISEKVDIPIVDNLPELELNISENIQEPSKDYTEYPNESLSESEITSTPELICAADAESETIETSQLSDVADAEPEILETSELISAGDAEPETIESSQLSDAAVEQRPNVPNFYSSPLIRKWMQSQGYTLPETIDQQDLEPEVLEEAIAVDQLPVSIVDDESTTLVVTSEVVTAITEADQFSDQSTTLEVSADVTAATTEEESLVLEEMENQEDEPESTAVIPALQLPPANETDTNLAWLAAEIVVDDVLNQEDVNFSEKPTAEVDNPSIGTLSIFTSLSGEPVEPLPIPQLHVPEGELIAGNSIRVRVELPKVPPQVVAKLWVEDCQTRWLLDGPHLLTELLPNSVGGMEVMIPLNIPFGCLEIRIEAIALNRATQQESHKVSVFRTVIPPELGNPPLDELLSF
jgi:hypothetical protein